MEQAVELGPSIGGITILGAMLAGAVSFLSPCVLPLVPGYLSAVTGVAPGELGEADRRAVLIPALIFVASFSVIFILLGLGSTAIGSTLNDNREILEKVGGAVIIAMGVFFIATMFIARLNREIRVDALMEKAGSGGPLVAGAAFAIAWTPCAGPTLGAILTLAGATGSPSQGAALLAFYSAGLAIPFVLSALAFVNMSRAFDVVKRYYWVVIGTGGAILIAMGWLMITGQLTRFNGDILGLLDDLGLNLFSEL